MTRKKRNYRARDYPRETSLTQADIDAHLEMRASWDDLDREERMPLAEAKVRAAKENLDNAYVEFLARGTPESYAMLAEAQIAFKEADELVFEILRGRRWEPMWKR